jgi:hypothetical protein
LSNRVEPTSRTGKVDLVINRERVRGMRVFAKIHTRRSGGERVAKGEEFGDRYMSARLCLARGISW